MLVTSLLFTQAVHGAVQPWEACPRRPHEAEGEVRNMWSQVCHLCYIDLYLVSTMSFRSISQAKLALRIFLLADSLELSAESSKLSGSVSLVNQTLWIYLLRNPSFLYLYLLGHPNYGLNLFPGSSKLFGSIIRVSKALWIYIYMLGHPFFGSVCKVIHALRIRYSGSSRSVIVSAKLSGCVVWGNGSLNLSCGSSKLCGSVWMVI